MELCKICKFAFAFGFASVLCAGTLPAQNGEEEVAFADRNLSGPRLGITIVPRGQAIGKALDQMGVGTAMSQFGWHFERVISPKNGGPSFTMQFIPLVGGVEYKKLIVSGTVALGIRFPDGIEFGLGPNFLVEDQLGSSTALMAAVGKSFNYSGVSIPVDFVYVTNPNGARFGLIFGYAIRGSGK